MIGDLRQTFQLGKGLYSAFNGGGNAGAAGSGGAAADGDAGWSSSTDGLQPGIAKGGTGGSGGGFGGSMLGGGGVGANAAGAIGGAVGLYSAYQSNGGVGGALQGGMAGMELGMSLGGPIGAAIGAAGGAILGAIGFGGREKARVYWLKGGHAQALNDIQSFQQGGMDYLSAFQDLEALDWQARSATGKMGPSAHAYYNDTIKPELQADRDKLTREQKAGRTASTMTAAQYDWGGPVDNFGSFRTGPQHGMIHAQQGEFVVEQQQAASHYQALSAINAGATRRR